MSEAITAAILALLAGIVFILATMGWIFLSVLLWAGLGAFLGWAFSGHFAIWENLSGLTMSQIGAMLGFVSAAFRVSIIQQYGKKD